MSTSARNENRLTPDDIATIRRAIGQTVARWRANGATTVRLEHVDMLMHVGVHAIGCTDASLRISELAAIRRIAGEVAATGSGRILTGGWS